MTNETINENTEDANETPVQDVAPSETNLTIQDLTTCMQIIAVCGQRGAIKAEEMAVVGTVYNKIFAFLDASGAIKRPDAETTGEAADDSGSAVESIPTDEAAE